MCGPRCRWWKRGAAARRPYSWCRPITAATATRLADVFEALRSFTPLVEGLSVDEAFLDVGGLGAIPTQRSRWPTPPWTDQGQLGLPASVGIATNKFLAKLASEEAKPDGISPLFPGHVLDFLHPLSVRRLWGVGEATYVALEALRSTHRGGAGGAPGEAMVVQRVGGGVGLHLMELANGSRRALRPGRRRRQIHLGRVHV